jgi:hypothetical protein
MMKFALKFIFCLTGILFIRCQYDPYADDLTTVKPTKENLLGTYHFESQTVDNTMNDTCFSKAVITLTDSIHYEAHNMPYFKADTNYHYKYHGLVTMQGKWDIETNGAVADGAGGKETWGVRLDSMPYELRVVGLMQNTPPNKLVYTYGDPDAGAVIIFKKD